MRTAPGTNGTTDGTAPIETRANRSEPTVSAKLDALAADVRRLDIRVGLVHALLADLLPGRNHGSHPPKRRSGPVVAPLDIRMRWHLWQRLCGLARLHRMPTGKTAFIRRHPGLNESEFMRWFAHWPCKQIAIGSYTDNAIVEAIQSEIAGLLATPLPPPRPKAASRQFRREAETIGA